MIVSMLDRFVLLNIHEIIVVFVDSSGYIIECFINLYKLELFFFAFFCFTEVFI